MDCVELAIPYLLELVQARFPKLRTSVSATTRVASVDTVRFV